MSTPPDEPRKAGAGAREKAAELRAAKPRWRRVAERAFDVHTEERAWRKGAEGEELVGRRLDKLDPAKWRVLHDLTLNADKGTNLDHLVIGTAGVFTINTKKLTGKITITENGVWQNGRNYRIVEAARSEAKKVSAQLSEAADVPVNVHPVIIIVHPINGPEPKMKGDPEGCTVMFSTGLRLFFWKHQRQPDVLTPHQVDLLASKARAPETWA